MGPGSELGLAKARGGYAYRVERKGQSTVVNARRMLLWVRGKVKVKVR